MNHLILAGLFILIPASQGSAESESTVAPVAHAAKSETPATEKVESKPRPAQSNDCLVSEELVQDLEAREKSLKDRESKLVEREKEIESQKNAITEEVNKLDVMRAEIQGIHGKQLAEREEKVNKLIDTLETMSPKAAAGVMSRIDEDLATLALLRLSTLKSGKILTAMDPAKSSKLSELLALGRIKGKEGNRAESSNRAPASNP